MPVDEWIRRGPIFALDTSRRVGVMTLERSLSSFLNKKHYYPLNIRLYRKVTNAPFVYARGRYFVF